MKKYIILIFALFVLSVQLTYSQNFQWAKGYGGNMPDNSTSIYIDENNNIYFTGGFRSIPAYFDTFSISASGYGDLYLAKTDPIGNIIWVSKAGSNDAGGVEVGKVVQGCGNNVVIGGQFFSTSTFDTLSVTSNGSSDGFLAKYNDTGRCLWVKKIGGGGDDYVINACSNVDQDILVCGSFSSSVAHFDTIDLTGGSSDHNRVFLTKYDTNGNCIWAKQSSGGNAKPYKIAINDSNIYMTGFFDDSLTINGITLMTDTNPDEDIFVAKFDINGNLKWLKQAGGMGTDDAFSLCIDDTGNCFITGSFNDTATFGTHKVITTATLSDMFVAKYDTSGNCIWVRQINSSYAAVGKNIIPDGNNGVYVTGSLIGTASFGSYFVDGLSASNMFIARYDNDGNCLGVRNVATTIYSTNYGLCLDSGGNCVIAGMFSDNASFDGTNLTSHGTNADIFLTKLDAITGMQSKSPENDKLYIYANPNTGKCNITVPDEFLNETKLLLTIYNLQGAIIQQQELSMEGDKIKLNLEAEAKGIYTATLSNGKKVYTGKIVYE
jgi:hypothetical protein